MGTPSRSNKIINFIVNKIESIGIEGNNKRGTEGQSEEKEK